MHLMKTKTDSELEKQQKRPRAESIRRRAVEKFLPAHIDAPAHAYAHYHHPHSVLPLMWLGSLFRV